MTTIPAELLQAIADAGDAPVRLVDPRTERVYVLMPDNLDSEVVSSMESLIDDLDPEDWVDASRYGL